MSFFLCIKYLDKWTSMIGKYLEEAFCGCDYWLFQRAGKFHSCIQFVSAYLPFHLLMNVEASSTYLYLFLTSVDPVLLSVSSPLFLTHTWWNIVCYQNKFFILMRLVQVFLSQGFQSMSVNDNYCDELTRSLS